MSGERLAVTFLITGLTRGGAETQLVRVARELAARDAQVHVICLGGPGVLSDELDAAGIPVDYMRIDPKLPSPWKFLRLVRRLRASEGVLVCFMFHANVAGRIAGRLAGVPAIVASIRNEHFGGRLREALERWTGPLGQVVTTNSETVAESLVRRRIVSRSRIEVVPNCLTPADPPSPGRASEIREELGAGSTDFLWLAVGRLEQQKNVSGLIAAFELARERHPTARLAIAGEGSLAGNLRKQIDERGLAERITLLGLRADVPDLLGAADAYVLSSAWESSPNSLLEAALAGLPSVATDVGGVREILADGENGLVVPAGDTRVLANALERIMSMSADERTQMAGARRPALLERSSVSSVVDRWEQVIREALERAET